MRNELSRIAHVRALASIGEARRIREAANVSLRELAQEVDVHASTLSRWEAGEHRPRRSEALRWEAALARLQRVTLPKQPA